MRTGFALLIALAFAAPAWGAIYKCPDANGKTKFQDKPCAGSSKNENKMAEAAIASRWPAGHKNTAIALCRAGASRKLGVSEAEVPEIGPVLDSCNCIFDRLEKQYTAEYFIGHQDEIKSKINQLISGPCAPKLQ